jgi:hypothetical protein
MKKSLVGKTLIKNFSNTIVVLVTTIPAQTKSGMIDYTFLLQGKNDICKPHFPPFMSNSQINQLSLTQRTDKNRPSEEPF